MVDLDVRQQSDLAGDFVVDGPGISLYPRVGWWFNKRAWSGQLHHQLHHIVDVDLGQRGSGGSVHQRPHGRQETLLDDLLVNPKAQILAPAVNCPSSAINSRLRETLGDKRGRCKPAFSGVELKENAEAVPKSGVVLCDGVVPQQHQTGENLGAAHAAGVH